MDSDLAAFARNSILHCRAPEAFKVTALAAVNDGLLAAAPLLQRSTRARESI